MNNNKTILTIIAVVCVIVGYNWFLSGSNQNNTKSQDGNISLEDKKTQIVRQFVEKYKPNIIASSSAIYTFQLEDELVKANKPILFTASVDDILRKNGKFFIKFAPSYFDFFEPQIFYTLLGCDDKIDKILSQENMQGFTFAEYVVVAKITNIEKAVVKINGSTVGEDVELELSQSGTFFANGECLDLEFIEEN